MSAALVKLIVIPFLALLVVGLLLLHPVGPALVLLLVTPFEGSLSVFGPWMNLLTAIPILMFLLRVGPGRWTHLLFGTPIQQIFAVFLVASLISHAMAIDYYGSLAFLEYGRKAALFLIVGVMAYAFQQPRYLRLCIAALTVSMTFYAVLSMLEFYGGLKILPGVSYWGAGGSFGLLPEETTMNDFRLRGAGGSTTVNRFAMWMLLPLFLGLGWMLRVKGMVARTFVFVCLGCLFAAMAGTVSRAAFLGFAVGALVVIPIVFRARPTATTVALVLGVIAIAIGFSMVYDSGYGDLLRFRFETNELQGSGREERWRAAWMLFARSPIIGAGVGGYRLLAGRAAGDAHNAFLNLAVEAGLVGLLPFLATWVVAMVALARQPRHADPEVAYWRPFFLGSLVAMFVSNCFNAYSFERVTWIAVGFAVTMQAARRRGAAEARRRPSVSGVEEFRFTGMAPTTHGSNRTTPSV